MGWKVFHLTLRFLLELVALGAIGYWGFQTGQNALMQFLLGIGMPLIVAIIWGLFVAPRARIVLNPLLKEGLALLVFGSAALALAAVGQNTIGVVFFGVALVNSVVLFRTRDEPLPEILKGN